jgi:osmotically inducible protein OsmC
MMAKIVRKADAVWHGGLQDGHGHLAVESGAFQDKAYSFKSRFAEGSGTNPEELLAASHGGCFTMAFSGVLTKNGYHPESLHTKAVCIMTPKPEGGFKVAEMHLHVTGQVPGISSAEFSRLAVEAEMGCPISNVLKGNIEIIVEAELEKVGVL